MSKQGCTWNTEHGARRTAISARWLRWLLTRPTSNKTLAKQQARATRQQAPSDQDQDQNQDQDQDQDLISISRLGFTAM